MDRYLGDAQGAERLGGGEEFTPTGVSASPTSHIAALHPQTMVLAPAVANVAPTFAAGTLSITRVSTDSSGGELTQYGASQGVLSPDGREIIFQASDPSVVPPGVNVGLVIKDLQTGLVTFLAPGSDAAFSADGTKMAFASDATDLVAGDTNATADIFVKDLTTGTITRVSTDSSGGQSDGYSSFVAISADGTKVVFQSGATNLVPGDTNGHQDIFAKDLITGAVTLVSSSTAGVQANNDSNDFVISQDGTKVAFYSTASNLVANDTNYAGDIFVKDLTTGVLTRVSTDSNGGQSNGAAYGPLFSPDGTKIAFYGPASNLVPGDTNGFWDLFVKDLNTGAITRVSTTSSGAQANGSTLTPAFSHDGTKIAFVSYASNLSAGDSNGRQDVFIKDLVTGEVTSITVQAPIASSGNADTWDLAFSADDSELTFTSRLSTLVPGDTAGQLDVFVVTLPAVTAPTYVENGTAVQVISSVNIGDSDSANYAGGSFAVAMTNSQAGDAVSLSGPGISIAGGNVSYYGTIVGTLTLSASGLTIALNAAADDFAVKALAQAVHFSSSSDNPTNADRTIAFTLDDGAGGVTSFDRVVHVTPVDDPATATNDSAAVAANATIIGGSVIANDDPDGPLPVVATVAAVNGSAANVGTQITLASGAHLTLNADGTYTYDPNHAFDTLSATTGATNSTATDSFTYSLVGGSTATVTITIQGSNPNVPGIGSAGDDTLYGSGGNDRIDGGTGADTMYGGAGDDTYVVDETGDQVIENPNAGTDTVESSIAYALGANVENLTLTGTQAIDGSGNALDNVIRGNSAANTLDGGAGADTMYGGAGDDTYVVDNAGDKVFENANEGTDTVRSSVSFTLGANVENLVLTGTANISGYGNSGHNTITGNAGSNVLDGAGGGDTLQGGAGNDVYYIRNAGDTIVEGAGEGTIDTALATVSYTLNADAQVERLAAADANATTAINLTGNAYSHLIQGNNGANVLTGGSGNDNLFAYAGDDRLDGGQGVDQMTGGMGNDTYVVDNGGDQVIENVNEGTDTVESSITYTLGANVENLTLTGGSAIDGTGNSGANVIHGNAAANTLNGGGGSDMLYGGGGDDIYIVGNVGVQVFESANEGIDTVRSSVSFTLGANIENLVLTGTGNINGYGNAGQNTITGNAGSNVLDGAGGGDTLQGGAGNDVYYIRNAADTIVEGAGEGTNDTVLASVSYVLNAGAQVERLAASDANATTAIDLTGNAYSHLIQGNNGVNTLTGGDGTDRLYGYGGNDNLYGGQGNDTLDGGTGTDMLYGGAGDDTYVIGDAHAKVIELAGEGNDIVQASVSYSLAGMSNIETLQLTGTANISATGNAEHNILIGNAGSNVLDGAGGGDTLQGGAGNDVYYVRDAGDTIVEGAGQGTADTVLATLSYTLNSDAQVERLAASDANATTAIDLTGNAWSHLIQGNNGANVLTGGSGNDTLYGYGGNDSLFGGAGADKFVFAHGTGQDTVGDFVSGTDKLDLTAFGFASYQDVINATHDVGGNAVIDLGNGDQVTLTGVTTAQLHSGDFVGVGNSAAAIQVQPFALNLAATDTWHGAIDSMLAGHGSFDALGVTPTM
jgi:Ca2+-binding RTX toxin-like protein